MKILKKALCLVAFAALLVSCKEPMPETPTISVSPESLSFEIEGGQKVVTVKSNYNWEAQWDASWITVTPSKGEAAPEGVAVTITALKNEGKNQSAAITFYGNNSKLVNAAVTVEQEGAKGDDDSQLITCAQFSALPDGETVYKLRGAVSGSINTQYGNFDVSDETGSVYVYGCVNWADYSSRVSKGDTITVKGAKTTYNGKIEMKDATILDLIDMEPVTPPAVTAVYYNNFDKAAAEKTYGSGSSWPYLDQFDGWKNESGDGAKAVEYLFSAMSARNNSNSDGTYSDYAGSGVNNLFFGKKAYFVVKNIAVADRNLKLSFGAEKYLQSGDNTFNHAEFHVYVSNDAKKWVELTYTFPNGDKNARWDIASSVFTLPSGVSALNLAFVSDVESAHRMDDLKLEKSDVAGTAIDFTKGKDIDFGGGGTIPTGEIKDISIKDFLASTDSLTNYRLTGIIKNVVNTVYGNFDLVSTDGRDSVFIYGIVDVSGNNVFTDKGLKATDTVTLYGKRKTYQGKVEIEHAIYESHKPGNGGDTPASQITATHPFTSSDTLTIDGNSKSYKEKVKINDTQYPIWKMGTSSKVGTATLTLKKGTKSVGFYALGWSGKSSVIEIVNGDTVISTVTPVSNTGISGNSPYTLTILADTDYYTLTFTEPLAADTTFTVRTTANNYRAVMFGINSVQ